MEPSPEQFAEWLQQALNTYHLQCAPGTHGENKVGFVASEVARLAYKAGADAELEACCEWLKANCPEAAMAREFLHAARRPQSPSLKEQAIQELDDAVLRGDCITISSALTTIRKALNSLPDS